MVNAIRPSTVRSNDHSEAERVVPVTNSLDQSARLTESNLRTDRRGNASSASSGYPLGDVAADHIPGPKCESRVVMTQREGRGSDLRNP